jgi:hypothetical protein
VPKELQYGGGIGLREPVNGPHPHGLGDQPLIKLMVEMTDRFREEGPHTTYDTHIPNSPPLRTWEGKKKEIRYYMVNVVVIVLGFPVP